MPLLNVENLSIRFSTSDATVDAVNGISFSIDKGQTLCVVGESGCGKSVTALSILGLLPTPPAHVIASAMTFDGIDLTGVSPAAMREIRGNRIAMIFQDPMTSLNPVFTCGAQIAETLRRHRGLSRKDARARAIDLLEQVKIPDPHKRVDEYPHQMSGGMRQRVMIAVALACNPEVLIADEPTTALDVTIQAQILELLRELQERRNMAVLFITHDLGIVARIADQVLVLYAGRVAERAPVRALYTNPRHPYTVGLLNAVPRLNDRQESLAVIPGSVPDATTFVPGCRFYDRCPYHTAECTIQPEETVVGECHRVACFHPVSR